MKPGIRGREKIAEAAAYCSLASAGNLQRPATVRNLQKHKTLGKRKRLASNSQVCESMSELLGKAITPAVLRDAMRGDTFRKLRQEAGQAALDEVGAKLTRALALAGLELGDGNLKMYRALYNSVKGATCDAGYKASHLPNPHQVNLERQDLISKVPTLLGEVDSFTAHRLVYDKEKKQTVRQDTKENVWIRTNQALSTLVRFYGITPESLKDKKLQPCLKVDECKWVSEKNLERFTLTMLNGGLDEDMQAWWSVQSEKDIWTLGAYEVDKENHDTLKWNMSFSDLSTTIERHNSGRKLVVEGVGEFEVEWHLAGDLKTLKALYGTSSGANAKFACIYCLQQRKNGSWGRACACPQGEPPDRDSQENVAKQGGVGGGEWDPILPIPLTRVHMCTMHAENRIIEKLVHLPVSHVWNASGDSPGRGGRV
ncbi:hypothetical protein KFL_015640020 [Klebsormidium nitens]|uniref:Uncharacterized protein n=1 Tax=Klebsormidium nitens TaxID=105231 RepID=A0A1Y1IXJ0_KLENI|nr:hypothetical protein KFL_015640020 [Klebsormidium nitens]|eukprot:GAQ93477.1 hypothetical protein KFL_015640020 [Klebsormidium nitens]